MPSPGQPIVVTGVPHTNYTLVKKKTVSPRNQTNTSGFINNQQTIAAGQGPKMLLMADKN